MGDTRCGGDAVEHPQGGDRVLEPLAGAQVFEHIFMRRSDGEVLSDQRFDGVGSFGPTGATRHGVQARGEGRKVVRDKPLAGQVFALASNPGGALGGQLRRRATFGLKVDEADGTDRLVLGLLEQAGSVEAFALGAAGELFGAPVQRSLREHVEHDAQVEGARIEPEQSEKPACERGVRQLAGGWAVHRDTRIGEMAVEQSAIGLLGTPEDTDAIRGCALRNGPNDDSSDGAGFVIGVGRADRSGIHGRRVTRKHYFLDRNCGGYCPEQSATVNIEVVGGGQEEGNDGAKGSAHCGGIRLDEAHSCDELVMGSEAPR